MNSKFIKTFAVIVIIAAGINLMCHFTLSNTFVFNIPHFNHNLPLHTIYFVIMNMKGRFLCDESD